MTSALSANPISWKRAVVIRAVRIPAAFATQMSSFMDDRDGGEDKRTDLKCIVGGCKWLTREYVGLVSGSAAVWDWECVENR